MDLAVRYKYLAIILILYTHCSSILVDLRKSVGFFSSVDKQFLPKLRAIVKVLSPETEYRQLKIHLCGDSRAGKTTLRHSLFHCIRNNFGALTLPATSAKVPEKLDSTIGLEKQCVPIPFDSNEVVLCDYGGQDEYHINHSSHLASGPGCVYVVVVGLAAVDENNNVLPRGNQGEKECNQLINRYKYWLRFINSVAAPGSLVVTVLNFKTVTYGILPFGRKSWWETCW